MEVDDCTAARWGDEAQAALARVGIAAAPVIGSVSDDLVPSRELGGSEQRIKRFRVVGLAWGDESGDDQGRVRVYSEMDLTVRAPLSPMDRC